MSGFALARALVASPGATDGEVVTETSRLTTLKLGDVSIEGILRLGVRVIDVDAERALAVTDSGGGRFQEERSVHQQSRNVGRRQVTECRGEACREGNRVDGVGRESASFLTKRQRQLMLHDEQLNGKGGSAEIAVGKGDDSATEVGDSMS